MSLMGAMNTAISGLTAQSSALGNISDNVANSQTVGFKRIDTNFIDYLTSSTAANNTPGVVLARPDYVNDVQGAIEQQQNPLALAITGEGFFAVSQPIGGTSSTPTFDPQQYYTRAGDFQQNASGYLVNSAGNYLNGWPVNSATGVVNTTALVPIKVDQSPYNPVATSTVDLAANLPATPSAGSTTTSQLQVYDALGTAHTVTLNWTQNSAGNWTVGINAADDTSSPNLGTANVLFGQTASGNAVLDGTVGNITGGTGTVTTTAYAAGGPAVLTFTANFASGPQTVTLNLGTYGQASGVTQYAGTQYSPRSLTQNGVAPGNFVSVSAQTNGDIVETYDNGQTRVIAQVPIITFANPDALQRQDGQSFTATIDSGSPSSNQAGTGGAGNLVTNATEGSNVDIATEFSNLIVAQRAYSANAKMITTADDMLQTTIDMKR